MADIVRFRIIPALSVIKRGVDRQFYTGFFWLRRFIRFRPDDAAATYFTPITRFVRFFFHPATLTTSPPPPGKVPPKKYRRQCRIRGSVDHDSALQSEWSAFMRFEFRRHARAYTAVAGYKMENEWPGEKPWPLLFRFDDPLSSDFSYYWQSRSVSRVKHVMIVIRTWRCVILWDV